MELHRIYCSHIQQVEMAPTSLHPDGAYILIDPVQNTLGAWSGLTCRNLDRLLAETVAAKVMQTELRQQTSNDCHILQNKIALGAPPPFYLAALHMTANDFISNVVPFLLEKGITNDPNSLYSVDVSDDAALPEVKLIEEKRPDESINSPGKLSFSAFEGDKIVLLESGRFERYLWIGGRTAPKQAKQVREFIKKTRGEFVHIRDRMETILFKEKFLHVADCFGRKKEGTMSSKAHTLKPIESEVRRMVDENFGTLSMLGDHGGPVGDNTRTGMFMSFADDEDGQLSIFRVTVSGHSRSLDEYCTNAVVFSSSRAYAVLYVCKNNSRAFVYLWVGNDCPADVQAALALRCKEIFPPGVAPDQIHVQQGREPALLLRIIAAKKHIPLVVVARSSYANGIEKFERCLELSVTNVLLPNQSSIAIELPISGLPELCPQKARVYIAVSAAADKASPSDRGSRYTAKSVAVRIAVGCDCSEVVLQGARSVAEAACDVLRTQEEDSALEALHIAGRCRVGSIGSHSVVVNEYAQELADVTISYPHSLKATIQEISAGRDLKLTQLRPIRLFQVSQSRRAVGAMFVEEIGSGGVFLRGDLSQMDCYILDSGADVLYVWMGAKCLYPSLALVTRVVRQLVSAMHETVRMIASRNDDNSIPYEPVQLHFDTYFKIDASSELTVEYIRAFEECIAFTDLFRDWYVYMADSGPFDVPTLKKEILFDPHTLDDDEATDAERDLDGRLLSESTKNKLKYSETEEYRTNSILQQEKRNRRASTGENFTTIKLKSTPPPSDYGSRRSTPETSSIFSDFDEMSQRSPAISPLASARRLSTGSQSNPHVSENINVDHFLKVKLKSTLTSSFIYTPQSSPGPVSLSETSYPNDKSFGGKSDAQAEKRLPSPSMSAGNNVDFRNVKLKKTSLSPSAVSDGSDFKQEAFQDISPPKGELQRPVHGQTLATFNRRASTGSHILPKTFVPPVGKSGPAEDFRHVKLRSTQPSRYQLIESMDDTQQGEGADARVGNKYDNSRIDMIVSAEISEDCGDKSISPSNDKVFAVPNPGENVDMNPEAPHASSPPQGCCTVM